MRLKWVPYQDQRPAAMNGEAEAPPSSTAFHANPGLHGPHRAVRQLQPAAHQGTRSSHQGVPG